MQRELDAAAGAAVLIARSGLDLSRIGQRYSHAAIGVQDHPHGRWSVRQLYYACDEGRPRLFDQGLGGFLSGTEDPAIGYLSIVVLPEAEAKALARAALDKPTALALLGGSYSANAHPFRREHQNCNQWVIELLAAAWGGVDGTADARAQAQRWLAAQGYAPAPVQIDSHVLMFAAGFMPWIRFDDHPRDDVNALRFHVSLPATIEAFVQARLPNSRRIEVCHDARQVVVRRGGAAIAAGCVAAAGDEVIAFD